MKIRNITMVPLVACSLAAVQACAVAEPSYSGQKNNEDPIILKCVPQDMAWLIGESREILATIRLKGPVRVIEYGQLYTEDLQSDRLNIDIGQDDLISNVWCG